MSHMLITRSGKGVASENVIREFITKNHGHFLVAGDDRIFLNVLRRTAVTELGLPSNCMTVLTNAEQLFKNVREMAVKHKSVLLFAQETVENKKIDDVVRQILVKVPNCKIVLVVTESELNHLALLREQGLADNWIVKPVVINQLLEKVANIIKPHGCGAVGQMVKIAQDLLARRSYNHVLTVCRKIFEQQPESPVGYMLMGDAYRGLDMEAEMIEAYEQATYNDHLLLEPIQKIVEYFRGKNVKDREVVYLEKLDAMSPLNMERKMDIARIYLELGKDGEAAHGFEDIMKITGKRMAEAISDTANRIGFIYAAQGKPLEAEKYFRRAIEVRGENLDKSNICLFNNLGLALRRAGKWKQAVAEYQRALTIDPGNFAVHYNMALAFAEGGDFRSSCEAVCKAQNLNPGICKQDHVVAFNMGMIFHKNSRQAEAKVCLENALAINPRHEKAARLLKCLSGRDFQPQAATA